MTEMTGRSVRVRDRIVFMLRVTILAVAALCSSVFWVVHRRQAADLFVAQTEQSLRHLSEFSRMMLQAESSLRGFLLSDRYEFLVPYAMVRDNYREKFDDLVRRTPNVAQLKCDLPQLGELAARWTDQAELELVRARANDFRGAIALVRSNTASRIMEDFNSKSTQCANEEFLLLADRRNAAEREGKNVLLTLAGGGVVAAIIVIVVAFRAIRQIEAPLDTLLKGIDAFGKLEFDRRIEVGSRDEFGLVAKSFNAMADRLQKEGDARERAEKHLNASLAELERSNRELDQYAYVASHDLKAPLRGIRSLADWITEDIRDGASPETLENLSLLHNRVERLDGLLDSMLQYSRVGRGGGAVESVDSAKLVDDITYYLAPKPGFSVVCSGEMPVLKTSKAPLELVLRNLISNAIKHHDRDHGTVTVSAGIRGDLVEFHVADDGPGIPPAFHERIFQMFQTLKPRDQVEGSGMGLAIVKKEVESNGGAIRVESDPGKRGTTFIFTWPLVEE